MDTYQVTVRRKGSGQGQRKYLAGICSISLRKPGSLFVLSVEEGTQCFKLPPAGKIDNLKLQGPGERQQFHRWLRFCPKKNALSASKVSSFYSNTVTKQLLVLVSSTTQCTCPINSFLNGVLSNIFGYVLLPSDPEVAKICRACDMSAAANSLSHAALLW